jgi:RNA polymerase sigma factor (sigma-70 family)
MSAETGDDSLISALEQTRRRFLELIDEVRPELHRYCARMVGSTIDGEDVVQDTLAQAYFHLSELKEVPPLKPWLFRIAHHRAIDAWRRASYRQHEPIDAAMDVPDDAAREPDTELARRQAVQAAFDAYLHLGPTQRACVILKDVLEHSLDEIAELLELSIPAVKAALHRGRAGLRETTPLPSTRAVSSELQRYVRLFNAHDWDGVRALLADDVRLDLVSRRKLAGRAEVAVYFTNYERMTGWHLVPGWLDGREVIAVHQQAAPRPGYYVELRWRDGRIAQIKDLHHVRYIADDSRFVAATTAHA